MIRTIFFDFDGVLTIDGSGSQTTCAWLHAAFPDTSLANLLSCYRDHQRELLSGSITHEGMWNTFCACIGAVIDIEELLRAFRATPANDAMFDICNLLLGKYQLGIMTDNSRDRFEAVKDEMNLSAVFDYFLVSGKIGSQKDRPEIFIEALKQTGSAADECVFIDNNRANLVIPKQLGFETLFHDHTLNDVEYLVTCLKHVGVTL